MGVFLVIFVIFLILMLIQIVWMAMMIYKLRDSGKQLDDATGHLREELARRWNSDEFAQLLNGPVVPILPEIQIPDLSPEVWMAEAPPVADAAAWESDRETPDETGKNDA